MDKLQNTIINQKWMLKKKLSSGSFGVVYNATDVIGKEDVIYCEIGRSKVGEKGTGRSASHGEGSLDSLQTLRSQGGSQIVLEWKIRRI